MICEACRAEDCKIHSDAACRWFAENPRRALPPVKRKAYAPAGRLRGRPAGSGEKITRRIVNPPSGFRLSVRDEDIFRRRS